VLKYTELDAWKACDSLFFEIRRETQAWRERDPGMADRLQRTALKSASKLAFGSGTGSQKRLRRAAEWSAGYLSQLGHDLAVATALGLVEPQHYQRLDALRGRATFYVWRLILPDPPPEAPPEMLM
jgi:hypothetical protein